jgi:[acyl-carrier-protein] S-malonyltransferase
MTGFGMVFPGQGSQSKGMLSDIAATETLIRETFAEASEALGYDLWTLVAKDPEGLLDKTEFTQPAILTASVALFRLWLHEDGPKPVIMAGHSLGEYSALVCANAMDLRTGVTLVQKRGQLMQSAVPEGEGAMAAVLGLQDEAVRAACDQARGDGVLAAVNYNAPGQVVIAGDRAAVERGIQACKQTGARRAMLLPVSVPSHSDLMKPASAQLADYLDSIDLRMPEVPVIHNVDAQIANDLGDLKTKLVRQLYMPVQWVSCLNHMTSHIKSDPDRVVECGPGRVLSGLSKRINRGVKMLWTDSVDSFECALGEFHE